MTKEKCLITTQLEPIQPILEKPEESSQEMAFRERNQILWTWISLRTSRRSDERRAEFLQLIRLWCLRTRSERRTINFSRSQSSFRRPDIHWKCKIRWLKNLTIDYSEQIRNDFLLISFSNVSLNISIILFTLEILKLFLYIKHLESFNCTGRI